jgi:hypothetical protein
MTFITIICDSLPVEIKQNTDILYQRMKRRVGYYDKRRRIKKKVSPGFVGRNQPRNYWISGRKILYKNPQGFRFAGICSGLQSGTRHKGAA